MSAGPEEIRRPSGPCTAAARRSPGPREPPATAISRRRARPPKIPPPWLRSGWDREGREAGVPANPAAPHPSGAAGRRLWPTAACPSAPRREPPEREPEQDEDGKQQHPQTAGDGAGKR